MIYFHIAVSVSAILICYKWGDWRNWSKYYPTILFLILGNLIYNILFHNKMLWIYVNPTLNHTLTDLMIMMTAFPSTVMAFIPNFPKGTFKQVVYIFFWVFIYSLYEYISVSIGGFKYDNGWSIGWSIIFNIALFSLLYLHYKKPLLAWFFTIVELIVCLLIFKVDVMSLI